MYISIENYFLSQSVSLFSHFTYFENAHFGKSPRYFTKTVCFHWIFMNLKFYYQFYMSNYFLNNLVSTYLTLYAALVGVLISIPLLQLNLTLLKRQSMVCTHEGIQCTHQQTLVANSNYHLIHWEPKKTIVSIIYVKVINDKLRVT